MRKGELSRGGRWNLEEEGGGVSVGGRGSEVEGGG